MKEKQYYKTKEAIPFLETGEWYVVEEPLTNIYTGEYDEERENWYKLKRSDLDEGTILNLEQIFEDEDGIFSCRFTTPINNITYDFLPNEDILSKME